MALTSLKEMINNNNQNIKSYIDNNNSKIKEEIETKDSELKSELIGKETDDVTENTLQGVRKSIPTKISQLDEIENYYTKSEVDNISTFGNTGNEISLENNEINLHSDGSITLSSGTSTSSTLDIYNEEIAITTNKITINDKEIATKEDIPTDIEAQLNGYKKDTIDNKINNAKTFATSEANQALQDAKDYVDSKLNDVDLEGYVKDEELAAELTNYITRSSLGEDGSVNLNADWNEIENKPEILQDSNINSIMTLDKHNEAMSETNNDISTINQNISTINDNISSLSNGLNAKINVEHTGNVSINGTITANQLQFPNYSSISQTTQDSYPALSLSSDGSGISISRALSISGDYGLDITKQNTVQTDINITNLNGGINLKAIDGNINLQPSGQFSVDANGGINLNAIDGNINLSLNNDTIPVLNISKGIYGDTTDMNLQPSGKFSVNTKGIEFRGDQFNIILNGITYSAKEDNGNLIFTKQTT